MADAWQGTTETLDDIEEREVLFAALDSFRQYRRLAHLNVTHRRRQNFYALPTEDRELLSAPPIKILDKFNRVDDAIDANAVIADKILETGLAAFNVPAKTEESAAAAAAAGPGGQNDESSRQKSGQRPKNELDWHGTAKPGDMEKAKITIRQFFRDWSVEGGEERRACYGPVLHDLDSAFAHLRDKGSVRVLIPGAGLGRLVFEVCRAGYTAEGNEISFHQLMASNWVLNSLSPDERFDLYPSALIFSNQVSADAQLKKVSVPDVHPGTELDAASRDKATHAFERMSMTAADFMVLYADEDRKDAFDAVATVFFIDTAPNVVQYIRTIHSTLREGGYWINLGPLLWHFEEKTPPRMAEGEDGLPKQNTKSGTKPGIEAPGSVELTKDELLSLVQAVGFEIQHEEVRDDGFGYIQDPESMVQSAYRVSHFVAKKIIKY